MKITSVSIKCLMISFLISLIVEIFVFNYSFFRTFNNTPTYIENVDHFFTGIDYDYDTSTFIVNDSPNAKLYINISDSTINEILFDITLLDSNLAHISVESSDFVDGSLVFTGLAEENHPIINGNINSKYISISNSANLNYIDITIPLLEGNRFIIESIVLNPTVPFSMNPVRFLILLGSLFIFAEMILNKKVWTDSYFNTSSTIPRIHLSVLFTFLSSFSLMIFLSIFSICNLGDIYPYEYLTLAFAKGQLSLPFDVPSFFEEISNPYNPILRSPYNGQYLYDTVLFEGHYYVYFGALPCIIFYLPYYLLTGNFMPKYIVLILLGAALISGLYFMLKALTKKYFNNISTGMFVLNLNLLIYSSFCMFAFGHGDEYIIPGLSSVVLIVWGIYFMLRATKDDTVSYTHFIIGSILFALVATTRPTFLIYSLCALSLFVPLLQRKDFAKIEKIKSIVFFILSYAIVAIPLMIYNYLRFHSITDFGTSHQLTVFDMTSNHFEFGKLVKGIYYYFFASANTSPNFPYISLSSDYDVTSTFDHMYIEPTAGGLFPTCLILALPLLLPILYREIKKRKLAAFLSTLLLCSFAIAIFDIEYVGVTQRYFLDFSFAFGICSSIVILIINEMLTDVLSPTSEVMKIQPIIHILYAIIILLVICCILYSTALGFSTGYKNGISLENEFLFYYIYYMFKIW